MAKLSALQATNKVLQNIGEASNLTVLTSLSTIQQLCFDKINEAIQDICTDENTRWKFLESEGQIPMTTGNYKYLISGLTYGADLMFEDIESFRQEDSSTRLKYLTPQEWDNAYIEGIGASRTGYPNQIMRYAGYFVVNNQATATQNGKIIYFRYWKTPAYYAEASPSGTVDIPEPFDRTLLVPLATLKVMAYLGSEEAALYKVQVFGNGSDIEGALDKMKRIQSSPIIKPRMTYVL